MAGEAQAPCSCPIKLEMFHPIFYSLFSPTCLNMGVSKKVVPPNHQFKGTPFVGNTHIFLISENVHNPRDGAKSWNAKHMIDACFHI